MIGGRLECEVVQQDGPVRESCGDTAVWRVSFTLPGRAPESVACCSRCVGILDVALRQAGGTGEARPLSLRRGAQASARELGVKTPAPSRQVQRRAS